MSIVQEIQRRRTFAIISHPDAGKTTLTEKLLLFGGAIQTAGAVKSNKITKTAASDFMEIERQRGISVSTSVMGFEYRDLQINILDTPGHEDFAEDTYRTLTAVDSAIVVIDVANGVEKQTEKLTKVCRMRETPIIFFVNKMDREGKDAFDLLDEIEQKLSVRVCPLSWPIGMGQRFKGVYNLYEKSLILFNPHGTQDEGDIVVFEDLSDPELERYIGETPARELRSEVEMVETVYPEFNREDYASGDICPIFFGSAVNNFGVKEMLDCFVEIAPPPLARITEERVVQPTEEKFTGFNSLEVMNLSNNLVSEEVSMLLFVNCPALKELHLYDNPICKLKGELESLELELFTKVGARVLTKRSKDKEDLVIRKDNLKSYNKLFSNWRRELSDCYKES